MKINAEVKKDTAIDAAAEKAYWFRILKIVLIACGILTVGAIILYNIVPSEPAEQTTTTQPPAVKTLYAVNEDAAAGAFTFNVKGAKIASEIGSTTTENQFVIVSVKFTNNDVRARDFSTGLFTLIDSSGKTYKAAETYANDYLVYETLNPGLSKTAYVAFETPKGISGFKLNADSGLLLAGGETVTIDLGK